MTKEELENVRAKLKRSDEIMAELDILHAATSHNAEISYYHDSQRKYFANDLARRITELGRTTLIAQLEGELAGITLNEPKQSEFKTPETVFIPTVFGPPFTPIIPVNEPFVETYEVTCLAGDPSSDLP